MADGSKTFTICRKHMVKSFGYRIPIAADTKVWVLIPNKSPVQTVFEFKLSLKS